MPEREPKWRRGRVKKRLRNKYRERLRKRRYARHRRILDSLQKQHPELVEAYALARTYEELIKALQNYRRHRLRISSLELDDIAGFQDGYTSKLEIGYRPHGRGVGNVSLPAWLQALGVALAIVPIGPRESREQSPRI